MSDGFEDTKTQNEKHAGGAPSKYGKLLPFLDTIKKLAKHGLIDTQISDVLGICRTTLANYKKDNPEFSKALRDGKKISNKKVERALYERAIGYSCVEDKIFLSREGDPVIVPTIKQYPPETTACIYWTKNRMPKRWKDKQDITVNDGVTIQLSDEFIPDVEPPENED